MKIFWPSWNYSFPVFHKFSSTWTLKYTRNGYPYRVYSCFEYNLMPSLNSKYSMALFCIKYSGLIHLDIDLNLMLSMKLYNFKLLSYPRRLCSMKRSTAIYSFFSNSVPAVMDVYFIPSSKKMTFQRPSQSLKLIIQEWWGAFQTDTIWHIAFHFWTFQRISIEWIDNKVSLIFLQDSSAFWNPP